MTGTQLEIRPVEIMIFCTTKRNSSLSIPSSKSESAFSPISRRPSEQLPAIRTPKVSKKVSLSPRELKSTSYSLDSASPMPAQKYSLGEWSTTRVLINVWKGGRLLYQLARYVWSG